MKKNINLVDVTDLLHYASTIGYSWNDTIDLLDESGAVPHCNDGRTKTIDIGETIYVEPESEVDEDADEYGEDWSEDVCKILNGFMVHNDIQSMVVVNLK